MTNVSCINCKWRKDMICIPCSKNCKSQYELSLKDLLSNKTTCDFYRSVGDQYTFGQDRIFYTYDVHKNLSIMNDNLNSICICIDDPSKVIINGVMWDYEDRKKIVVQINKIFDIVDDYRIYIIQINNDQIHCLCKAITIRYDKYDNDKYLFIDLVGAYGGRENGIKYQ